MLVNIILFCLNVLFVLCGATSTALALKSGKAKEKMRVMRWLIKKIGLYPALVARIVFGVFFLIVLLQAHWIGLAIVSIVLAKVCFNNIRVVMSIYKKDKKR